MKKSLFITVLLATAAMAVTACTPKTSSSSSTATSSASSIPSSSEPSSSEVTLSSITISGADDVELAYEEEFNLFTGVTAIGNDSVDYTSQLTLQSTSAAANLTTGAFDSTQTGTHAVRYTVNVNGVIAQKWRTIVVDNPESEGMLINPDFSMGTVGWDDPSVVYIADGAAMTLSTEDGALKAEIVAGTNMYTPRFGQMGVPFDNGITYEVGYDAKSSVEKKINCQVGELLSSSPYFTDFKVGVNVHHTITTEWAHYSYKFTMNQSAENHRGGILFEVGTVESQKIDATMYFDNITIVPATADADTDAPVFSGVNASVNVTIGSAYDPMAGVTAYDVVDGDVTGDITYVVKNAAEEVVAAVDSSAAATYTIYYSVEDDAGNIGHATTVVHIVSMLWKDENLVADPSFESAFNETTPEWAMWSQDWGSAPVVTPSLDTEAGTYSIGIVGGGDAVWAVQLYQDGYITLKQGVTYRLQFDASSTVSRPINVALGYGNWVEYGRQNAIEIGTTSATYDYVFTCTQETHAVKLVFELGAQTGFADSTIVFSEVRLQEHAVDPIITNGDFSLTGWRGFCNDWEGSAATWGVENGEFRMDVSTYNNTGNEWALQVIQDGVSLGGTSENGVIELTAGQSYTIGFDAYASEDMNIHPYIISSSDWANLVAEGQRSVAITTVKTHYEVTATAGSTVYGNEILKFQFGDAWASFSGTAKSLFLDNIVVTDASSAALSSVYNGDMETPLGGHNMYTPSGDNTVKVGNDGLDFNIVTLGGAAHEPHYYYMIDSLEAGNYAAVLDLTSEVARDYRFNIVLPDSGYASILPDTKYDFHLEAGVATQVVVTFSVSVPLTNVKIELDLGTLGGDLVSLPSHLVMSQIIVYRDYNAA